MRTLSRRDRALAQRLVLGVVACSGALDLMIDRRLRGGTRLEPRVRDALRLSAYELCWLHTPAAVAVYQGVELVREIRRQASGLANAVLRQIADSDVPMRMQARDRATAFLSASNELDAVGVSDLSLVSGCPAWLLQRILDDRGPRFAATMALMLADTPPVFVAANLALCSTAEAERALARCNAHPLGTASADALQAGNPAALAKSGLIEGVQIVVADLAAQQVASAVAPRPGGRVLEVGQGRGTKSILLENAAIAAGGPAEIVGIDTVPFKVRVATDRMRRAGLSDHVTSLVFDGRNLSAKELPEELSGMFELVLVDAPCSGTGTMRRHPETAWALKPRSLDVAQGLPGLQLSLLAAASARVGAGGMLAYSTCSVLRAENEDVVERFLASPDGRRFTCDDTFLSEVSIGGADGHFLARLRRRGA